MSKKFIAIFTALALVVTLLAPIGVQEASAASKYDVTSGVKTFNKPSTDTGITARIKVEVPENAMTSATDSVWVELPAGVTAAVYAYVQAGDNQFAGVTPLNTPKPTTPSVGRQEVEFTVTQDTTFQNKKGIFFIELRDMEIESRYSAGEEVKANFTTRPNSVFSNAAVTVARVSTGKVNLAMLDVDIITDSQQQNDIANIRVTEDLDGALASNVKLKLPRGFYWVDNSANAITNRYGDGAYDVTYVDPITTNGTRYQSIRINATTQSTEASSFDVSGLRIEVDPTLAEYGPVVATVSSGSNTSVAISELTVATYGDYLAEVSALSTSHRLAGKTNQELGKFEIRELVGDSLVANRTVTMTLPVGAKWVTTNGSEDRPNVVASETENNMAFTNSWEIIDIEGRTIRTTIANATDRRNPAKVVFKGGKVAIEATFEGDLEVTFGGSAGVGGTVTLAKVTPPVTGEVSELKDIRVGFQNQKVGDLTITETKSSAMARGQNIVISAPLGVLFATTPTAEVVEGDAIIDRIWTSGDKREVLIRVLADSDKATEIKVSNIEITIDRTLPEGALEFTLGGGALVNSNTQDYFERSDVSAWVKVANIVTPASRDTRASDTVVITIGQNDFTVGEETWTMDAPAFIDANGRTMMPLRAVAEALNVSSDDILWEPHSKTVTIMKGDRTAQVQIGKRSYIVNGITVPMDTEAVIVSERTFLPLRHVANALGVSNDDIEWDENTKTVTIFGKKDN